MTCSCIECIGDQPEPTIQQELRTQDPLAVSAAAERAAAYIDRLEQVLRDAREILSKGVCIAPAGSIHKRINKELLS